MVKKAAPRNPKLASLRGKMGAMQKRMNKDSSFHYLQMALLDFEKGRSAEYHRMLRLALDVMSRWGDTVTDLIVEAMQARAAKFETEHQAKVAERRQLYETTKGKP